MEMTIDEAIKWIEEHHSIDLKCKDDEAHRIAISTMHKYQKIEKIVGNYGFDTSWICLKKIREVVEDEKD